MKSQRTDSSRIVHSRFIVATATVLVALATGPIIYVAQANTIPAVEAPTAAAVASTLVRCGLSAESLAAAGVDAAGATSVRAAMATKLENDGPTLSAATESLASARTALESLRKSITGEPSQAESAQIAQAGESVAAAESTLASCGRILRRSSTSHLFLRRSEQASPRFARTRAAPCQPPISCRRCRTRTRSRCGTPWPPSESRSSRRPRSRRRPRATSRPCGRFPPSRLPSRTRNRTSPRSSRRSPEVDP
jgi:hypothetical protein